MFSLVLTSIRQVAGEQTHFAEWLFNLCSVFAEYFVEAYFAMPFTFAKPSGQNLNGSEMKTSFDAKHQDLKGSQLPSKSLNKVVFLDCMDICQKYTSGGEKNRWVCKSICNVVARL